MEPNLSLSGVFCGRDHMCIGEFGLYPFWHTIFDTWSVFTCSWFICPAALKPCVKWFCWRPVLTKFRRFSPMFWNTLPRISPKPCSSWSSDSPNESNLRPQLANSALAASDRSWNIFRSFLLGPHPHSLLFTELSLQFVYGFQQLGFQKPLTQSHHLQQYHSAGRSTVHHHHGRSHTLQSWVHSLCCWPWHVWHVPPQSGVSHCSLPKIHFASICDQTDGTLWANCGLAGCLAKGASHMTWSHAH